MTFTDKDLKQVNKLLKTQIEDTQFYQGYSDRCKVYAKALKAILARLQAAERACEQSPHGHYGQVGSDGYKAGCDECERLDEWRKSKGE